MPIVVDRRTGKIISAPELTQEQKDAAWEVIIRNWVKQNPEKFLAMLSGNKDEEDV